MKQASYFLPELLRIFFFFQDLSQYATKIKKRFEDAVTEAHIIAYITNPRYINSSYAKEIDFDLLEKAEKWLGERNPDFEVELEKFKLRTGTEKLYSAKMFTDR